MALPSARVPLPLLLTLVVVVACEAGRGDGGDGQGATDAAVADSDGALPAGEVMVYVGSGGAEIRVFELDRWTLALAARGASATGAGPSFLAFDPQARWLVAVNEGASAVQPQVSCSALGSMSNPSSR